MLMVTLIGNMNILHISTHNESCGIGKYQEMYLDAMHNVDKYVKNIFFPYSPNFMSKMNDTDFSSVLNELDEYLEKTDVVHVQHEFSFYGDGQLEKIVNRIKASGKPLVSTIHTNLPYEKLEMSRLSPKWPLLKFRTIVRNKRLVKKVQPLDASNLVIVHNSFTKMGLVGIGYNARNIIVKPIPVPKVLLSVYSSNKTAVDEIYTKIDKKPGDIIIATVGYINEVKGILSAVKALALLPKNYKLLVLGGIHPRAENDVFLDEVGDFILKNGLIKRVYITGVIESDDELNALVRSADIVVYPYGRLYMSSSAALNNGFANHKPIIATRTKAFNEIMNEKEYIKFTQSFSYYDLARLIASLSASDINSMSKLSEEYAIKFSYPNLAKELIRHYKSLISETP